MAFLPHAFALAWLLGAAGAELPAEAVARLGSHRFVHPDRVRQLGFLEEDRRVFSRDDCGAFRIWDLESGECVWQSAPEARRPLVGPGEIIARAVRSGQAERTKSEQVLTRKPGAARAVGLSLDGSLLAAAGLEAVTIFDARTGAVRRRLGYGGNEHVWAVAFSADGRRLAAGGDDFASAFGRRRTGRNGARAPGTRGRSLRWPSRPTARRWPPAGTIAACASGPGGTAGSSGRCPSWAGTGSVTQIQFSPDGTKLAVHASQANRGDPVTIRAAATGRKICSFDPRTLTPPLAFLPDSREVASGMRDGSIAIWDAETGALRRRVGRWKAEIEGLQILPGGKQAAWMGEYQGVGFRDLATGRDVAVWDRASHADRPLAAAGSLLVIGSKIWDVPTREILSRDDGSGNRHPSALSPDGRLVAWADAEGVHLWEALLREEIHLLGPAAENVPQLAFSPDGMTLAAAQHDGSVLLWDVTGGERAAPDGWAARRATWRLAHFGTGRWTSYAGGCRPRKSRPTRRWRSFAPSSRLPTSPAARTPRADCRTWASA